MRVGELVGESKDQIRRYIRLTELVPEILQMVDERQIAFRPAVEVSYLTENSNTPCLKQWSTTMLPRHWHRLCSRKQSISEGAMTALGISKRQEFCNQERRHWRGADAAFT